MKIGVNLKIDVTKINKNRLYKGEKGTYLNAVAWIDTENVSDYGDNGMVIESISKEERQAGVEETILGNNKVFFKEDSQPASSGSNGVSANSKPADAFPEEDIPF